MSEFPRCPTTTSMLVTSSTIQKWLWPGLLDARYRIEEMIPKRLSNKGVKKSRLKFNPVLALIRLRTTGPWSLNPLEETLLQSVLKSFITVFIQYNEGLENNLTRAPLLGLAKSILYR